MDFNSTAIIAHAMYVCSIKDPMMSKPMPSPGDERCEGLRNDGKVEGDRFFRSIRHLFHTYKINIVRQLCNLSVPDSR